MEFPIAIAKAFGIYLVISGVFLMVRGKTLPLLLKDFFQHRAVVFLAGMVLIFLGSVLILRNDAVAGASSVWIAVIGWLALIKGAIYILRPEAFAKINIKTFRPWLSFLGIVMIALGIYLFCVV